MTAAAEFKFNCPVCGQHIQVAMAWSGRRINCPACKQQVVIPSPPEPPKEGPATTSAKPSTPSPVAPAGSVVSTEPPEAAAPAPTIQQPAAAPPSSAKTPDAKREESASLSKPTGTAAPHKPPEIHRVAVLTPAIKLDLVRAVRRRIADESVWLPGKIDGANAYAAKAGGSKPDLVDVKDPQAARFSLIGAFELEFHLRNVITTAEGRAQLLNQEIPEAVQDVLRDETGGGERGPSEAALAKVDVMSLSHAQCLAVLEVLEERYSQTMDEARAARIERRIGNVRLLDLVRKLEARGKISPEDVATALYYELTEVRRRLDRLESRTIPGKKDT